MKHLIVIFFSILFSNCYSQLPDLAERTFKGNLSSNDFVDQEKYIINLDTSDTDLDDIISRYHYYVQDKQSMVKILNQQFKNFHNKEIQHFIQLEDNVVYYPSKSHWYCITGNLRIDWWFSSDQLNKLTCITLGKIKKGT